MVDMFPVRRQGVGEAEDAEREEEEITERQTTFMGNITAQSLAKVWPTALSSSWLPSICTLISFSKPMSKTESQSEDFGAPQQSSMTWAAVHPKWFISIDSLETWRQRQKGAIIPAPPLTSSSQETPRPLFLCTQLSLTEQEGVSSARRSFWCHKGWLWTWPQSFSISGNPTSRLTVQTAAERRR